MNVVVVVEVVEIVKASPVKSKLKGVDGDDDDDDVRGIIERNSRITSTIRTVKSRDRVHQHHHRSSSTSSRDAFARALSCNFQGQRHPVTALHE